ncbi:hypothetical protein P3X46_033895 [Hevea brasiliensis]|uniref:GTD-binding domain-containing protein n=1 Tax=Hevea brasiliensis TaxID=3981 RepID=A0ABQ9KAZ4_HEVBR|nr:uncharacterized protein LOC131176537 [Hevea brasiliensis]KAJ9129298.1 hypothetical protein P3X46_033895 [Hevea brasiliensis]
MAGSNFQILKSRAFDENDMLMGALLSQKSGTDLMQNCDLPPPLKVFSGSDKTVISPTNRFSGIMGREEDNNGFDIYGSENEKLELFKALRLSQTRAREAERKAASLIKERDCISNALLRESMQLFAYRQWVKLLEVQVFKLQSERQRQEKKWQCSCGRSERVKELFNEGTDCEDGGGSSGVSWMVAMAFCLGIAGVGLAFGFRYLF